MNFTKLVSIFILQASTYAASNDITLNQLNGAISPCGQENSAAPGENIACSDALRYINGALNKYNLKTPSQKAFYLSTMAIESGKLSYNKNHYPGRPGQGTRSMMMPDNLYNFAKDSKDIQAKNPKVKELVSRPYDENNNDAKEQLLKELMKNEYSFLPGAWWISRGAAQGNKACSSFSKNLAQDPHGTGQVANLLKNCVGVEATPERMEAYSAALKALQ